MDKEWVSDIFDEEADRKTALQYRQEYESQEFRADQEAPGAVLGAVYSPEETCFRVWAPYASQVWVRLYSCGTPQEKDDRELRQERMHRSERPQEVSVWEVRIAGDLNGVYYTFEVSREGGTQECVDIYARACGADGKRGMVIDLGSTDPEGWDSDREWCQKNTNTVIYELHVKDFSYHQQSGIPREFRGKYMAFTQSGTKTDRKETGLSYLKKLGISHVHLLPVFDFASVKETGDSDQFNWGYDPMNYNIPEGSYATNPRIGDVRIREFKRMVQSLHRSGIGVVMDVVYNHTFSSDGSFQVLAPYYYYRQCEDGSLSNGSACGNETASERTMCAKFIRESVLYWAEEYHIDGFRFDLMGLHDTQLMNEIRWALDQQLPGKSILVYGEPWAASASPMEAGFYPAVKSNIDKLSEGVAIFCDNTRDAIKGSVFLSEVPGFVNGGKGLESDIASSYQAWCDGGHDFTPSGPGQIISYVSVHDNYTLWDKLVLTEHVTTCRAAGKRTDQEPDYIAKAARIMAMNKLTAGIVFTCLGTPLFQAGEEFGRTKYGDENSYQSSPAINSLDWGRREEFDDLVEYYRGLIALRGQIPIYSNQSMECVRAFKLLFAGQNRVEICIDLSGRKCRWKKIFIVANASLRRAETILPQGHYQKLADEKSSWQWKKSVLWSKIRKASNVVQTSPKSIGIWGEI